MERGERAADRDAPGSKSGVLQATFSPDGQTILTASKDNTARLFEASSGTERNVFRGHSQFVVQAQFSPDGTTALTASLDRTARLGRRTGHLRAALMGHSAYVTSASFNPDGSNITTSSPDKTARIWRVNPCPGDAPFGP